MLCPLCGKEVGNQIVLCEDCLRKREERKRQEAIQAREGGTPVAAEQPQAESSEPESDYLGYAGFWLRASAFLVDTLIVHLIASLVRVALTPLIGKSVAMSIRAGGTLLQSIFALFASMTLVLAAGAAVGWLYYSVMESSARRATVGKLLLSLHVTDTELDQISFARASGRFFAKFISALLLGLGFLMAGLTQRKQALHDIVSGSLVVRITPPPVLRAVLLALLALAVHGAVIYANTRGTPPRPTAGVTKDPAVFTHARGSVRAGDTILEVRDAVTLFNPLLSRLEIAFFRDPISTVVRKSIREHSSLAEHAELRPDLLLSFSFAKESKLCSVEAIEGYQVQVNRNPGKLPVSETFNMPKPVAGVSDLSCRFAAGETVSGKVEGAAEKRAGGSVLPVGWKLQFEVPLVIANIEGTVHFESSSAADQAALFSPSSQVLEIGFYARRLAAEERTRIREAASLSAPAENKPLVSVRFDLQGNPDTLGVKALSRYSVSFFRHPEQGLDFPGDEESISFSYVASGEETLRLSTLSGTLAEGETITASLNHEAQKRFNEITYTFAWALQASTRVIDVSAKGSQIVEPTIAVPEEPQPAIDDFSASVILDNVETRFSSVVALYYPQEGDVALGFYTDQLLPEEREEIRAKRFLWTYVNNKRANLVMFLDFKRDSEVASKESLLAITTYLLRDKVGAFYFPGPHDRMSFKRLPEDLEPDEIEYLQGTLGEGSPFGFRFKGEELSEQTGTKVKWALRGSTELMVVD